MPKGGSVTGVVLALFSGYVGIGISIAKDLLVENGAIKLTIITALMME